MKQPRYFEVKIISRLLRNPTLHSVRFNDFFKIKVTWKATKIWKKSPALLDIWCLRDLNSLMVCSLNCYQNCSDLLWERIVPVIEKTFDIWGWRPRICKNFEITRAIHSNSERTEPFLVTECFFKLFLEVSFSYLIN